MADTAARLAFFLLAFHLLASHLLARIRLAGALLT